MSTTTLDLDRLLRLRVVVARVGEMDLAKWWNTKGQLGTLGAAALRRGFPRTHHFAQARSVFAVARQRCAELLADPSALTLFQLPESLEEEFDARWEHWLDDAQTWAAFFERVARIDQPDLLSALDSFELLDGASRETAGKLKRSAEGRAVGLPGEFAGNDRDVLLLAAGFSRGDVGQPAVPYMARGRA